MFLRRIKEIFFPDPEEVSGGAREEGGQLRVTPLSNPADWETESPDEDGCMACGRKSFGKVCDYCISDYNR